MAVLTRANTEIRLSKNQSPMKEISSWQKAIKQLMINIRTRDSYEIEEARITLKSAQNEITIYEEKLLEGSKLSKQKISLFRISESVRRLCAYARDFGEVLLNLKMYDEMIIDKK